MNSLAIALAIALSSHVPHTGAVTLPTMTIVASPPAPQVPNLVRCSAPRDLVQGSGTVRVCEVSR